MTVLKWEKPPQELPYEEWAAYQPDDGPPGAWVPNMPDDWRLAWKAKMAGQRSEGLEDLRIEIRKSVRDGFNFAQVLLVVHRDGRVTMSMNSKAGFSSAEWGHLHDAVSEARTEIVHYVRAQSAKDAAKRSRM